jgi:TPP-dependent indolepyruvate ferredoxin oxidoreductase alpha subunit
MVTIKEQIQGKTIRNLVIAHGRVESGVKVVAGYPGTPATEIAKGFVE